MYRLDRVSPLSLLPYHSNEAERVCGRGADITEPNDLRPPLLEYPMVLTIRQRSKSIKISSPSFTGRFSRIVEPVRRPPVMAPPPEPPYSSPHSALFPASFLTRYQTAPLPNPLGPLSPIPFRNARSSRVVPSAGGSGDRSLIQRRGPLVCRRQRPSSRALGPPSLQRSDGRDGIMTG